jgi:uncharacterized protein YegP (UPF0339 family)
MFRPSRLVLTCSVLLLTAAAFAAAPARRPPAAGSNNNGSGTAGNNRGAAADKKSAAATFEVYQDKAGEYRWRLRARNGQVMAIAPDGYKEKRAVMSAIESVRKDAADAKVEEQPSGSSDAKDGSSGGRK